MTYTLNDAIKFIKEHSPRSGHELQQKMAAYIFKIKTETGQTEEEIWRTIEYWTDGL